MGTKRRPFLKFAQTRSFWKSVSTSVRVPPYLFMMRRSRQSDVQ